MSCFYSSTEYILSKDQELFSFLEKHFRQRQMTSMRQRLFLSDFVFALKTIACESEDPRRFLRVIGICVFDRGAVAIQRSRLSRFICYESRVIRNCLFHNGWKRVSHTDESVPAFFRESDTGRYWSFYRVPETCRVFKIISDHRRIVSSESVAAPQLPTPDRPLKSLLLSFT